MPIVVATNGQWYAWFRACYIQGKIEPHPRSGSQSCYVIQASS